MRSDSPHEIHDGYLEPPPSTTNMKGRASESPWSELTFASTVVGDEANDHPPMAVLEEGGNAEKRPHWDTHQMSTAITKPSNRES
jgi:hypothetical protein